MPLTATQVTPLNGRVLVEKGGEFGARGSLLWRAPDMKEVVWEGRVLAAPPRSDVKAGDRILFGKYAGRRVNLEGQEFIMMLEESILGILTDEPTDAATDGTQPRKAPHAPSAA